MSADEVLKFFEQLSPFWRDFAETQFYMAARVGEVAGLQVESVDFFERVIVVRHVAVFARTSKAFDYLKDVPKNGEERFIFLNDKLFNKMAFDRCDKIIAITPWEIPILKKWVDEKKIVVIPNGMDNLFFKKLKENKFKEKNNIPKDKKIILFFGRLNPTKGPEKLALVARELVKERKDVFFAFIGPDEGKLQEVQEIIKDQENIKYFGALRGKDKIIEMYQAAYVYMLPSYREGLPLTLFEAMASGLPIIASPVNGIPYEMNDSENGLFVKYGDIKGLKNAIIKLLDYVKILIKQIYTVGGEILSGIFSKRN